MSEYYNKMKQLYKYGLVLSLFFVVTSIIHISCVNSSKRNNPSENRLLEATLFTTDKLSEISEVPVDLPIAVNVSNYTVDWHSKYWLGFVVNEEDEKNIFIDTTSPYYNKYVSGQRFHVPCEPFVADGIGYMEYLMLDLDIVNNTSQRIDVNELDFIVESSKLDSLPYVYIITESSISNTISFYNASWINWGGFSFMYSILKKGESFDGNYKECRHVDYFENDTIIDLLPDLLSMGYDFETVCRSADEAQDKEFDIDLFEQRCKMPYVFSKWTGYENINKYETILFFYQKDVDVFSPLFFPFETEYNEEERLRGIAKLYGKIKFDKTDYEVSFIAKIILSDYGDYGAGSNLDDHFDVELKTQGENYILRYPYTTVIDPYGAERVLLIVKVNKSSNHHFYISLLNNNDLNIRSKDIIVHYMSPRNYIVYNGK